jgi:hypothetical protein
MPNPRLAALCTKASSANSPLPLLFIAPRTRGATGDRCLPDFPDSFFNLYSNKKGASRISGRALFVFTLFPD